MEGKRTCSCGWVNDALKRPSSHVINGALQGELFLLEKSADGRETRTSLHFCPVCGDAVRPGVIDEQQNVLAEADVDGLEELTALLRTESEVLSKLGAPTRVDLVPPGVWAADASETRPPCPLRLLTYDGLSREFSVQFQVFPDGRAEHVIFPRTS